MELPLLGRNATNVFLIFGAGYELHLRTCVFPFLSIKMGFWQWKVTQNGYARTRVWSSTRIDKTPGQVRSEADC